MKLPSESSSDICLPFGIRQSTLPAESEVGIWIIHEITRSVHLNHCSAPNLLKGYLPVEPD